MSNVERTLEIINSFKEDIDSVDNFGFGVTSEHVDGMNCVVLMDIALSLSNIADALEKINAKSEELK